MSERKGIEIDYCPQCRGVWLDRGELDKMIEKSLAEEQQNAPAPQYQNPDNQRQYDQRQTDSRHYDERNYNQSKQYRKKSFWHEIFD